MNTPTYYQQAIKWACEKHQAKGQTVPSSNLPYVVHLSNVAMEILVAAAQTKEEFNTELAVQMALLHDTIEDTDTTFEEVKNTFVATVAEGVLALTKDKNIAKVEQMTDSLQRILKAPKEVWAVKLADRITNLQPPPSHWTKEKIKKYHSEATIIFNTLKEGNTYLAQRLEAKIDEYVAYF